MYTVFRVLIIFRDSATLQIVGICLTCPIRFGRIGWDGMGWDCWNICGVQATEEILRLVLQVMISDRSVGIRKALLWSLDEWFDAYLSREHHIGVSIGTSLVTIMLLFRGFMATGPRMLSVHCWGCTT